MSGPGGKSSLPRGVEEMSLKELNKNPLSHRSSYENYFIKVSLGEVDRAVYLLREGDKIQKSAILRYLPSLFKYDLEGCIKNILEKYVIENLWKEQPIDQVNIGKALIRVVPLLPSRTVGKLFPFLQSMMSVKNEKVSTVFEEVFFTTIPYLPLSLIEGDVRRFIIDKGSQFESERNRRFCSRFLGELCKRLSLTNGSKGRPGGEPPFICSQAFTTLVQNLCQDTSYVVRKNMARNIEYIGRKLGEEDLIKNGLMEELFQLIEDETKEVRIASFQTILNLLTDGLNDLYLRYSSNSETSDYRFVLQRSSSRGSLSHHSQQHHLRRRKRVRRASGSSSNSSSSSSSSSTSSSSRPSFGTGRGGKKGSKSNSSIDQSSTTSTSSTTHHLPHQHQIHHRSSLDDVKEFFTEKFRREKILPLFLSYFDHPPRDLYPELAQNYGLIFYKFVLRGDLLIRVSSPSTSSSLNSSSSSSTSKSHRKSSGGSSSSSSSKRLSSGNGSNGGNSDHSNMIFQTFFQNCCGDPSKDIRSSCAYNLPAVLTGYGAPRFVKSFLRNFRNLCRDESEEVRYKMAASFSVIVEHLSLRHKCYALLGQSYLKGLNDNCPRVQDKYFEQLSLVLSHFFRSLCEKNDRNDYIDFSTPATSSNSSNPQISERERIRKIFHENFTRTIQQYERRISMDWRLGILLMDNLELCCDYFPTESVKDVFLPLTRKNLVNSAIPLRQVSQRVFVVLSRRLCSYTQQVSLMKNVCSELAKGRSCRERITFLEIVPHVINMYSKTFFKKFLMDHVLSLSYDKVPVVKKKFCRIIPSLNSILSPSKDVKYIAILKERSSFLELDQEISVVTAAKEAKREIQAIELEVSRGRANQYSYHNQHEREDGKKEREEKSWMDSDGSSGKSKKGKEDKVGSLNIEEEIYLLQQKKYKSRGGHGKKKKGGKKGVRKKGKGGYKRKKEKSGRNLK